MNASQVGFLTSLSGALIWTNTFAEHFSVVTLRLGDERTFKKINPEPERAYGGEKVRPRLMPSQ